MDVGLFKLEKNELGFAILIKIKNAGRIFQQQFSSEVKVPPFISFEFGASVKSSNQGKPKTCFIVSVECRNMHVYYVALPSSHDLSGYKFLISFHCIF